MIALDVFANDQLVGVLSHDADQNRFAFEYASTWRDDKSRYPLSPQIPIDPPQSETAEQHSARVRQFFENLLPEGEALDHAAQSAGVAKSNLAGLLISIGKETAGALRVKLHAKAGAGNDDEAPDSTLTEITKEELSHRIRDRANQPFSVWDGKVRLSIAGYQDKIAVYERDGRWFLVDGGPLASTYIVKPLPARKQLETLPANEHFSMRLARAAGIPAAETKLVHVPEPVLFVRRFDRWEEAAAVRRLHVIDGCQALGMSVAMKYERAYGDGADVANLREGVSFPKLFALLDHASVPALDKLKLLRWAIFQVLIGNADAHGKNISFFYDAAGLRLAPAYDIVSIDALDAGLPTNFAMAVGDAFAEQDLNAYEWAHFAFLCKLPFRQVATELQRLTKRVQEAVPKLAGEMLQEGVSQEVIQRITDRVNKSCSQHGQYADKVKAFKLSDFT